MNAALLPAIAGELSALWRRLGTTTRARAEVWVDQPPATAPTIEHAVRCFGLSEVERDIVVMLLGMLLGRGRANHARTVPIGELIDAIGATREGAAAVISALEPDRVLSTHALVTFTTSAGDRCVTLADAFWPRLLGIRPSSSPVVVDRPVPAFSELAVTEAAMEAVAAARAWLGAGGASWPTLVVHGRRGSGRGALALAIAAELGTGVLSVPGPELSTTSIPCWKREISWHQAVPVVLDAERADPAALADLAGAVASPLVVTAETPLLERLMAPGRRLRPLAVPAIDDQTRAAIWRAALARAGADATAVDLRYLGARFPFTPARIAAAATTLAQAGSTPSTADAVALCRAIPELRFDGLAARIETPYGWDDLVVPAGVRAELDLIVTWGRTPALFAPGGMGGRARVPRGLACLFHGPPGTGKTLAVQVVARELGLELYRVDLAQVVDKYIGETEKRLDALFREAEAAGVILLFDEADALFTQRTEVRDSRDRYANLETGFLLQRLEDHRGLTILASNLQRNLDGAFQRRLGVVVELPPPGATERRRIWDKLLPEPALRDPDVDLELLAHRIPIAGGDIRNAVFAAVLIAAGDGGRIAMRHLVIAVWRELAKAGRLVDPADFGAWQDAIVAYVGSRR